MTCVFPCLRLLQVCFLLLGFRGGIYLCSSGIESLILVGSVWGRGWGRGIGHCIRSDKWLTLETSALQTRCSGQFTSSTLSITPLILSYYPTDAEPQFLQKLTPVLFVKIVFYINIFGDCFPTSQCLFKRNKCSASSKYFSTKLQTCNLTQPSPTEHKLLLFLGLFIS